MYFVDYHNHTNNSFDSPAPMHQMCEAAIARGIHEICFTEHFSLNPEAPTYGHMNFEKYLNELDDCQGKYKGKLVIKRGIEICEPHLLKDLYSQTLDPLDLDFILGSVHNINNRKLRKVLEMGQEEAYQAYFEEVFQMVSVANIDVLAHVDLLKRYAHPTYGVYKLNDYIEIIEAILKKAIERNIGIEINTSGLRGSLKEAFPSFDVVALYKELGGEILTVGSDAHTPDAIGSHIREAIQIAEACGFKYIYKFEKRKPMRIRIE
ncbi:histidinol-phosphatase HisJ family protein [Bacillus sp. FJAT-50079]|uniref:histidinol-phosphatase HisJ family protein n=1 Tax=Bacillus sp. FJAT-50079 TaxID=2833577 RepID=UPI001BCA4A4E|nr:histidinol-phosphatase HisJ family protein [Bacillus sp. FJAT-50079]MBS4206670.1 histidinol-phosphatase HisJ family protein [Bacillus sp. FJAT-50079]